MISATGKISRMPPAVWPAVSNVSWRRPACALAVMSAQRRSRSRRASSRLVLHSSMNGVYLRRRLVSTAVRRARREVVMMRGWKVCRMHGARGGAPKGKRNGNYKHGATRWKRSNSGSAGGF